MNALGSECSSGCESGWTLYLDHSFNRGSAGSQFIGEYCCHENKDTRTKNGDVAEEDLSMVSDASSGPPHFPDHESSSYFNAQDYSESKAAKLVKIRSKKRQKVKENQQHLIEEDQKHLPSFLDDTASSPVFGFSMNNVAVTNQQTSTESMLDYSQGFSATYFEERSSLQDHFGFLQSSLSENEEADDHNNKQQMVRRERDGNDIKVRSVEFH